MTKAKIYFSKVQELFEINANPTDGIAMSKYMRNLFPFYGIKRPLRKIILKEIVAEYGIPEAEVWELEVRSQKLEDRRAQSATERSAS